MSLDSAKDYLNSTINKPFFLFVGDEEYDSVLNELRSYNVRWVRLSEFCSDRDKVPDIDRFIQYIKEVEKETDVDARTKKLFVTGLGEFLTLRGEKESMQVLSRMKDLNLGCAKVILLLRGFSSYIDRLRDDLRFNEYRYGLIGNAKYNFKIILLRPNVKLQSALPDFKSMLENLETGLAGDIIVNTAVDFENPLCSVHKIDSAYKCIRFLYNDFNLLPSCGNDTQWAELLKKLDLRNRSFDDLFKNYDFKDKDVFVFINNCSDWFYFIFLKINCNSVPNSYFRFILAGTNKFEDLINNLLNKIIEIDRTDVRFTTFYMERKALVEKLPEAVISQFVINTKKRPEESVYLLTDNSVVECEGIIKWLSKNRSVPPELETIYPLLATYLKKYTFKSSENADELTEYFESYKYQKLFNQLEPKFLENVDLLAKSRFFNQMPTRDEIVDKMKEDGTCLYWLDALGVEYLGMIESLAKKQSLSIKIHITRAELPTLTHINKRFYDSWKGQKYKNKDLDRVKHDGTENSLSYPIHLVKELTIIDDVMKTAATKLVSGEYKRFLIVSDHGASRLAVLHNKEEKYDTDTAGEHSGRCCKAFQQYDLPFAVEENGYLVLADYGRFKGSRAATVEVHGGASLEEVVIPVIELSLINENLTVDLVKETVIADSHSGTMIELFFNSSVNDISVLLNGKRYSAEKSDGNHYCVKLRDVRKAGEYSADVYVGDNMVGEITFTVQGQSAKIDAGFDSLFEV